MDLLFVLNVSFHFVKLFSKQPARSKVKHTLISSPVGEAQASVVGHEPSRKMREQERRRESKSKSRSGKGRGSKGGGGGEKEREEKVGRESRQRLPGAGVPSGSDGQGHRDHSRVMGRLQPCPGVTVAQFSTLSTYHSIT